MPRILKRFIDAARAAGTWPRQPGLTPDAETPIHDGAVPVVQLGSTVDPKPRGREENESGVFPVVQAQPAESTRVASRPDPAKCKHVFATFALPAEGKGRVYQCQLCRAIGFKLNRFGGQGAALSKSIRLYTCSRPKCQGTAIRRMTGRGPRGAYIWACWDHSRQIEGDPQP